ncbi:MAG TPA: hypothetical protein VMS00_10030 [Acidimicrobiales bacterium]|nr:hypothetical protein [Acidimicrobiales bacterium]
MDDLSELRHCMAGDWRSGCLGDGPSGYAFPPEQPLSAVTGEANAHVAIFSPPC